MSKEPTQSAGLLLWRVTNRWQRQIIAVLQPLDLTHTQFVLLASTWWLRQQGEQPSQRRLADFAAVDPMTTSQVVRTLESKKLVTRSPGAEDARAWCVDVTAHGTQVATEAIRLVERADDAFFSTVRDRGQLLRVLRKLDE